MKKETPYIQIVVLMGAIVFSPLFASALATGTPTVIDLGGDTFAVDGAHVRATNAGGLSVTDPNEVNSSSALTVYAESVAEQDAAISSIRGTADEVSVTYMHLVKLFGFIPVTESNSVAIKANPDGDVFVAVDLPWWSLFVPGNSASSFSIELQAGASSITEANMTPVFSAATKAGILFQIEKAAKDWGYSDAI